ncbi:hypothetical protein SUGI_0460370 [Cryptomeria japonica]|uniref:wall-associated receptor kinase 1 n=1 Tax=Cryptomeria japonica TaxID=3369 RepID=UPI002408B1D2|nr:wall-associated receptor kinase 1 [Cryptomeria japonica]GLJ24134.1 hypothetical protein SUGI_0460370 [Cryptomeria japonica]
MSFCKQMAWDVVDLILICCYLATPAVAQCNPEWCGSQNVSFPFWISNSSCGLPGFQIKCIQKENGNRSLFLGTSVNSTETDLEIPEMSYAGSLVINSTDLKAISCNYTNDASLNFTLPADGPFTIYSSNKFVVIGCSAIGSFSLKAGGGACRSACITQYDPSYCNTYGCCEAGIPGNERAINFTGGGNCGFSTILDPDTWNLPQGELGLYARGHYGMRLQWGIGNGNCSTAKGKANYFCADAGECLNTTRGAYVCKCLTGYEGSGYSKGTGCTDVDECSEGGLNQGFEPSQGGICHNLPGTYNCSCAKHYRGDGFQNGTRCQSPSSNNSLRSAIIGFLSSFVGVSFAACGLFWCLRRRQLKYAGDKNFIENGGVEMEERIASMGGRKSLRMFSEIELKTASNNYSIELGKGGFATVYKGVLPDGMPVAIKKPKSFSPEFNNEIVVLSHINHRNVVKLIGCCLRTQLPLLVYEFVPNGTLFQHLQSPEKHLSWERRRQIAIETAEGIAYVHREASQPIFHRDIKSSNILLDDRFTPKVADFGISRLRPSDEMHLSTLFPSGTPGYVDPEFIRNNQFTEKSDVYSFGVVLLELLTGLKPLLSRQDQMYTLYDHVLSAINGGCLIQILDPKVVDEENQGQMENMAKLAKACLHEEGMARPSMREVVEELVWIRATSKQAGLLNRDATLPMEKARSTRTTLEHYSGRLLDENTSWDHHTSLSHTHTASEDPSSSLIQMSNMNGR